MPLLSIWKTNPAAVAELSVQVLVGMAGDGRLLDGSECSRELRTYLSEVTSEKLEEYVDHCLSASFPDSGKVLQDLVNELGRRLDFVVTDGLYQGRKGLIGYDGLWKTPEGNSLIVEVKTTDAYRISLDTVARYRHRLLDTREVSDRSSILIVVGRQDTGELEAQVRGSRHAWDVRLISTDALVSLVKLKESTEEQETVEKIRSVLAPVEYTKLDALVDVMFTTAKDVESAVDSEVEELNDDEAPVRQRGSWHFTDKELLQVKREAIVGAMAVRENTKLIRKSRALYWNTAHDIRIACSVSKLYTKQGAYPYWYAYHTRWHDFLGEGRSGFYVLGCMDLNIAFSIPRNVMSGLLPYFNTTTPSDDPNRRYWHIHVVEERAKTYALLLPKKPGTLPLADYTVTLQDQYPGAEACRPQDSGASRPHVEG